MMKRRISFILIICMVLTLSAGLFVPAGAAYVAGGGEIVRNDKGVIYAFAGLQKTTGAVSYYNYYQTGDGIVFADYNGGNYPAEISNDADGNLCAKINGEGRLELTFVSGFAYPNTNNWGAFYDINAIAIRYRVIGMTEDGNTTFTGTGCNLSSNGSLALRADGGWVETVCELTPTAEGKPFGNWKVNGDSEGNLNSYNKLHFGGLTAGTTLVIGYIGLFNSADDARAEIVARNSICIAENKTQIYRNASGGMIGRTIRLTGIQNASGNEWSTDCGITQFAPPDGRDFYNDADGNLVMVTKEGTHWSPLCLGGLGILYECATVAEMRYKTTDASGNPVAPPEFTKDNFYITYKASGADKNTSVKQITTTQDKNGWYVTRITFDSMWPIDDNLVSVTFPTDTSIVYVIDYVGFFRDEAVADANTKRARVFDDDAVRFNGVQVKNSGNGIRFVGVIDDYTFEAYEAFGFKICLGDKVTDSIVTGKIQHYVYRQIKANDALVALPNDYVTGQNCNSAYFTYCINDIPDSAFTDGKIMFKVCAYATIKGAEICGPTYTVVYDCNTQTVAFH